MKGSHGPCSDLTVTMLENVPLAPLTTLKIGGNARWLVRPSGVKGLSRYCRTCPGDLPRFILGGGSNLLVDDNGFHGVVVDLTHTLNAIVVEHQDAHGGILRVEAGAATRKTAHVARQNGLAGLAFMAGIPGTIGGALRMNAGAYGCDVKGVLLDAQLMDATGNLHTRNAQELGLAYRHCDLPKGWIFVSARFHLARGESEAIKSQMRDYNHKRTQAQPLRYPSAGSVFRNPAGAAAWQLIDAAGLRGHRIGDAQISEKHSNFFVNLGAASSLHMEELIELARNRVAQHSGVQLTLEIGILTPQGLRTEPGR
ncbi:UDP-N-acetylmuramate dehydrogenase [Magnetococcus marinus MC-1]|uniref:UDP-N-acetylenolpyruvoylglucosamine reductase n=1 Tax=Magnetococcus marinus (strain ATCC BAA-1437 / JCM 17883 / MC-1) TaxID=156889 RepID=MURB_MAGMM|nr:UDP-N-acetylmuramate dehydrogenase [Magnetococcus marinus]A0L5M9.1 RecName: Full=UDP-N-acetylenolpyruvoylglucosamine reductase; AltName: Full=UDP-N-acetylmuramate dehydrogenase [Magnetococcus marinus MC-1]ABK43272.1 UDP-N-acetylmuramate dehydrogenase [Magnetococcus marinus MC-1]